MPIELFNSVAIYWGGLTLPNKESNIVRRYALILNNVKYRDWRFELSVQDHDGHAALLARFNADGRAWTTRKYYLSPHMTRSEIIQTAFLCIKVAEEHETREHFLYLGKPIFGPHFDADKLASLCEDPDHLDGRS